MPLPKTYPAEALARRRPMPKTLVGLDVRSSSCLVVALDQEERMLQNLKITTSEVRLIFAVAGLPGEVHVHFEASELAGWVRSVFHGRVARIVLSHAKTTAQIANDPLKCDRRDTFKLAELLRLGRGHEVYYTRSNRRGRYTCPTKPQPDFVGTGGVLS